MITQIPPFYTGNFYHCGCFGRDLDLEYVYLYKPGRKPSRPFRYDVMLEPSGKDPALVPVDDDDTCFHRRLAANANGRLMCNSTTPMVNASLSARINISGHWFTSVLISNKFITDANGTYDVIVWVGDVALRHDIDEIQLMIASTCTNQHFLNPSVC
ncbi:hypothetical protein AAVH_13351 [Aphelenchoides avenae]|nr:hypothetical protein AAVH_13351 [Aphelenchus avenae]